MIKVIGKDDRLTKPYKKIKCHGVVFDFVKSSHYKIYGYIVYGTHRYVAKCKNIKITIDYRIVSDDADQYYHNHVGIHFIVKGKGRTIIDRACPNMSERLYDHLGEIIQDIINDLTENELDNIEDTIRQTVSCAIDSRARNILATKLNDISALNNRDNILQKFVEHSIIQDILE